MSFNSWDLNLLLILFTRNEILQKVLPSVFLDFASVPVKTESFWGEWKMKTVYHDRERHFEFSCEAKSEATAFRVPSWALIPVTSPPSCSLVLAALPSLLKRHRAGTLGVLQSSVKCISRDKCEISYLSCSLPAPECTQSLNPVNTKNTKAASLQKLKERAVLCLKKKSPKSSLSQFSSLLPLQDLQRNIALN